MKGPKEALGSVFFFVEEQEGSPLKKTTVLEKGRRKSRDPLTLRPRTQGRGLPNTHYQKWRRTKPNSAMLRWKTR